MTRALEIRTWLAVLLAPLLAAAAAAQVPGGTSASNPSVASQRVVPGPVPPAEPARETPLPAAPRAAPDAPESRPGGGPRFRVSRVRFEGVSVLAAGELAQLAAPYTDREITLAQAYGLARAVRDRYRRRGYLFAKVLIPPQKIAGGVLLMRVFEGRYGQLDIRGNRRYPDASLAAYFEPVTRHAPIHQPKLLRSVLLVNELPGLTVRSVLAPGRRQGTLDLTLNVREEPAVRGIVDYNNFGSRLVGRNRAGTGVTATGALTPGDELFVRVTEPFPSESDPIWQASYQRPVSARGDRVGLQYVRAQTRVGGVFAPLDQRGDVEVAAAVYTRPLERTPERKTTLSAAFTSKTIKSTVLGGILISQDDLRVLSLAGTTDLTRGRRRAVHQVSLSRGLGGTFNGRRNGDPLSSRAGAGGTFTRLNVDSTYFQHLGADGSFLARASGQLATDPLTVAELFALGGADTVRGFVQAEYLGDEGYLLSAEYRHALLSGPRARLELASFVDHGEASLKNPQPGDTPSRRLTGAGGGLRASVQGLGTTRVDLARPISTGRSAEGDRWVLYASHFLIF